MSNEEQIVKLVANQEVTSSDMRAMQDGPRESLDAVVKDALGIAQKYNGMSVTKSGSTDIVVQKGRYWHESGPRYVLDSETTISLLAHVPTLDNIRKVSLCVAGATQETDVGPRRFVTDATVSPPITQVQNTETRIRRNVILTIVPGIQGTAGFNPTIPAGQLEICRITLNENGIVGNPNMLTANRVKTLTATQALVDALQDLMDEFQSQLESLRSDIAVIENKMRRKADFGEFVNLSRIVANIADHFQMDTANTLAVAIDTFSHELTSDVEHPDYDCFLDHGHIRFPRVAENKKLFTLLNPTDPKMKIYGAGFTLPAFEAVIGGIRNAQFEATVQPSNYTQGTWTIKRLINSPVYLYYGGGQNRKQIEQELNDADAVKVYDPVNDTYEVIDLRDKEYRLIMAFYSKDFVKVTFDDPYPNMQDRVVVANINGSAVAQNFLNAQTQVCVGVDFYVTSKGSSGNIYAILCRTKPDGRPDLSQVKLNLSIDYADIVEGWNTIDSHMPAYIRQGKRFAWVFITQGNHVLGASAVRKLDGAMMTANDGTNWQANIELDIAFRLRVAKFETARTVVDLEPMELTGGIQDVDFAFAGWEPDGCSLVLQGQIGGIWRSIDHTDPSVFATSPALVPTRAVFVGSRTLQPMFRPANSRMLLWRPKNAMTHISTVLNPLDTENIVVNIWTADFDPDKHELECVLLTGVDYDTEIEPDSATILTTDSDRDPRTKEHRFIFHADDPITSFKIKLVANADNANDAFTVFRRRMVVRAPDA